MVQTEMLPRRTPEVQNMLDQIFDEHDRKYYKGAAELLLKLVCAIGVLSSSMRHVKGLTGKEGQLLARTFAWWVAVCSYHKMSIEKAMWEKFPGVCHRCHVTEDCFCLDKERVYEVQNVSIQYLREHGIRPATIADWQEMFRRLYGKINQIQGFSASVARLFEEIEEVTREIFPIANLAKLELELGDIGAWIFGLANLLGINLQTEIIRHYNGICDSCQRPKCICGW